MFNQTVTPTALLVWKRNSVSPQVTHHLFHCIISTRAFTLLSPSRHARHDPSYFKSTCKKLNHARNMSRHPVFINILIHSSLASISLNPERPAYVPPHMRNVARAPPAAAPTFSAPVAHAPINGSNGYHASPTGLPTPAPTPAPLRGAYVPPARAADDGGWGGAPRKPERSFGSNPSAPPGYGAWSSSGHVIGARNQRMEMELYGEVGDGLHQVSLPFVITFTTMRADLTKDFWYQFRQICRYSR